MKKSFLCFAMLLVLIVAQAHDFKLGEFHIKPLKNGGVELDIKLDRYDLLEALRKECADYNYLNTCFATYIKDHLKFKFDEQVIEMTLQDQEISDEFIELKFKLEGASSDVKNISIFNDVLIDQFEKQENVVNSHLYGKKRSFRLNKDRVRTTVEY